MTELKRMQIAKGVAYAPFVQHFDKTLCSTNKRANDASMWDILKVVAS